MKDKFDESPLRSPAPAPKDEGERGRQCTEHGVTNCPLCEFSAPLDAEGIRERFESELRKALTIDDHLIYTIMTVYDHAARTAAPQERKPGVQTERLREALRWALTRVDDGCCPTYWYSDSHDIDCPLLKARAALAAPETSK
jgi:hypothetical protein